MKKLVLLFSLFLFSGSILFGQILTESNLPIVVINTDGVSIPDEPKIPATMGIIDNGPGNINFLTDPFNEYDGHIGIETRGNSTQGFDKKTYSLELWNEDGEDISEPLLGMGSEEDWILHAMFIDKTQLRIPMSFYLFQRMGHYASNWRYVELIIDEEYRGLYILTERIKRDNDRVDIAKLDEDDIAGDSLTGGYILRIDWLDDPEGFESEYESLGGIPMTFQWYYPKAENIQPEQASYIKNWMDDFEDALFSPNYMNTQGKRYTEYIGLNSFTDFLLINELSKNSDGYKLSTYMYKERDSDGGKLNAGPIWDFDQTYGVSRVCSCDDPTGWTYLQNQPDCEDFESMPLWWEAMIEDTVFTNRLKCRWESMRSGSLHADTLMNWIDVHETKISEAVDRNYTQWDEVIGESIWIEPEPIPETYDEEIVYLKNWINERLVWLDGNMPGNCEYDIVSTKNEIGNEINIFPNPTQGVLNISFSGKNFFLKKMEVYDLMGKMVFSKKYNRSGNLFSANIEGLSDGLYFLKINENMVSKVFYENIE